MDFSTLVDLDDFFDDAATESVPERFFADLAGMEDYVTEVPTPESPEIGPPAEYKPLVSEYVPEEIPQQEVQQLRQEADTRLKEGGQSGFMDWWGKLPEKQQQALFRASMGAVGMGAQAAMQNIQQQRSQEFQREMQEREYQQREKERRDAEEARRIAGTPSVYQFNVTPRGIINQGMGG